MKKTPREKNFFRQTLHTMVEFYRYELRTVLSCCPAPVKLSLDDKSKELSRVSGPVNK